MQHSHSHHSCACLRANLPTRLLSGSEKNVRSTPIGRNGLEPASAVLSPLAATWHLHCDCLDSHSQSLPTRTRALAPSQLNATRAQIQRAHPASDPSTSSLLNSPPPNLIAPCRPSYTAADARLSSPLLPSRPRRVLLLASCIQCTVHSPY